jgi:cytochrome c oxidase subunit 2
VGFRQLVFTWSIGGMRGLRRFATIPGVLLLASCTSQQSALAPRTLEATKILYLFIVFIAVSAIVWIGVVFVMGQGLLRRKEERAGPLILNEVTERRIGATILCLTVATSATVLALSVLSYFAQDSVLAGAASAPLQIRILGHQWWWEVEYESPSSDQIFLTANEIHVPVGLPVTLKLETRDVIHSFWAPSLNGKTDLINGQENDLRFTVDRPGIYRGQCAEFCGFQHAHMGFEVIAEPPTQFDAWRAHQLRPAQIDGQAELGDHVFRAKGCGLCHTIRGTPAGGKVGPDLTHIGSRLEIAAAELPNNDGNLAGWIADPQHIKPGNLMPQMPLEGPDLIALVRYLGSLK